MSVARAGHDVERFDRWSRTYERSWLQVLLFDRAHRVVLDRALRLPDAGQLTTILDVGCGTGRLLRATAGHWPQARLVGVDPAAGMVRVARQLTPAATLVVAPAQDLPLPDASVDLAFSTLSFHHGADQAAGVREVARVLRPGGWFVLLDVSVPGWLARLFGDRPYLRPGERLALFEAAGLHVVEQRPALSRFLPLTVACRRSVSDLDREQSVA